MVLAKLGIEPRFSDDQNWHTPDTLPHNFTHHKRPHIHKQARSQGGVEGVVRPPHPHPYPTLWPIFMKRSLSKPLILSIHVLKGPYFLSQDPPLQNPGYRPAQA